MTSQRLQIKLQPLRIPSGWSISINNLYEIELTNESLEEWYSSSVLIGGGRQGTGFCFDARFEGDRIENGEFIVEFLKIKYDKYNLPIRGSAIHLSVYRTKSRSEFIEKIESYMMQH